MESCPNQTGPVSVTESPPRSLHHSQRQKRVVKNPLDTLQDYELRKLLKSKRMEICSIEDPFLLLGLLRDRYIIPEDKYQAMIALEDRSEWSKAIYKLLEWMDVTNSPTIRVFWNVLFEDCILSQYPQLQHLYDSLSRCDDSKTKPLGLHTRVPPTVTAQHSVRKHCEAQRENVGDFRFSEQSDSEGAGTSSLKRDAETHAEGSPAKRVRQDNKSLKKTRPLLILKSPDFAAVEQELSRMKQDLDTVKGELTTVKTERDTVKGELTTVMRERDTLTRELTTVKRERDTVKGELTTVKGELTTVKEERDTVTRELSTVKEEGDTVKGELTTVKRERDTVKGELTTVKGELTTVKVELTTVKGELTTVTRELTTVTRELTTVKRELTTVKRARDTVKRELTTVKRELTTVKGELTTVKRELTTVKRARDTVKGERDTVKRARDTVKRARDTVKGERDTVKDVPLNKISAERERHIYSANIGRCDQYALQIFKSLVNREILRQWAFHVNYNGTGAKMAVPQNVIKAMTAQVRKRFPGIGLAEEQAIRDQINGFLRRPNTALQR
ncbi:uncharacterized protein LOC117968028 [Acipenser ruthenus]|uniref:uncharacterized protein LOC117968028 n=1 Tax=Acipenser ruthenus TaxID=7906 RepID=UPI002740C81F|nr:uncharacterized protein LOC117968028 [Acipenser ruthenus]